MAFTTPKSWATSNVLTATDLNTYVRDNIAWLATDKPNCKVYRSSDQVITTATETAVSFDSELWDVGSMHSTSSNTSRLTVPSNGAGKYLLVSYLPWAGSSTGYRLVIIRKNGTQKLVAASQLAVSVFNSEMQTHVIDTATAGDYYETIVWHNVGSNLNVTISATIQPLFMAMWLGT